MHIPGNNDCLREVTKKLRTHLTVIYITIPKGTKKLLTETHFSLQITVHLFLRPVLARPKQSHVCVYELKKITNDGQKCRLRKRVLMSRFS